jgi:hypothetical protein
VFTRDSDTPKTNRRKAKPSSTDTPTSQQLGFDF